MPMLIVLNEKNSYVLWDRLPWLYGLPGEIIQGVRGNMSRLLQDRLSATMSQITPDHFISKMCIKSIQLL